MSVAQSLHGLRFFSGLPDHALAALASLAEERSFAAGSVIFREGAPCREIHVIESGRVALEMRVPGRGSIRILTAGPGELLGWSPLLSAGVMTATAIALEPTTALAFSGTRLRELCESQAEIGRLVMEKTAISVSERLIATRLQLLDLFK